MVDKFGTLGSMIASSFGYLSLDLRHEEKNDLLRNYSHFLQIAWNILLIWHNYDMFILMVITIGPIFVIILNFDRFKYWYCRPFFCQLDGFVCLQFMWVILVTTSTARATVIVFLLSMFILLVSTFSVIFGVSAMLGFFSFFKLFAAFRRPEEWWFRYHSAFPWNILINFSSSFLQSALIIQLVCHKYCFYSLLKSMLSS